MAYFKKFNDEISGFITDNSNTLFYLENMITYNEIIEKKLKMKKIINKKNMEKIIEKLISSIYGSSVGIIQPTKKNMTTRLIIDINKIYSIDILSNYRHIIKSYLYNETNVTNENEQHIFNILKSFIDENIISQTKIKMLLYDLLIKSFSMPKYHSMNINNKMSKLLNIFGNMKMSVVMDLILHLYNNIYEIHKITIDQNILQKANETYLLNLCISHSYFIKLYNIQPYMYEYMFSELRKKQIAEYILFILTKYKMSHKMFMCAIYFISSIQFIFENIEMNQILEIIEFNGANSLTMNEDIDNIIKNIYDNFFKLTINSAYSNIDLVKSISKKKYNMEACFSLIFFIKLISYKQVNNLNNILVLVSKNVSHSFSVCGYNID